MITFVNKYKKTLIILVLILFFCLAPFPSNTSNFHLTSKLGLDKWFHFLMYYSLFVIWAQENKRLSERVLLFIILSVTLGALVEVLQGIGPFGRSGSWRIFLRIYLGSCLVILFQTKENNIFHLQATPCTKSSIILTSAALLLP